MQNESAYKNESQNFLWQFRSENKIQMWPRTDSQRYITMPTKLFPRESILRGKILVPPRLPIDITRQTGILASAFSSHNKDYFVSHMGENFITCIIMVEGQYCAKISGKSYNIGKGDFFALPAGVPCDYFTRKKSFKLIWFHIKNDSEWRNICGTAPSLHKMRLGDEFAALYQMYSNELYSDSPSITFLQNALGLMVEILKRQFSPAREECGGAKLKTLLSNVNANLHFNWTAEKAAKKIQCTVARLNEMFTKKFCKTFPKYLLEIRMQTALRLVSKGLPLAEIARRTGFSTPYALSNTFKKHFGAAPKRYISAK